MLLFLHVHSMGFCYLDQFVVFYGFSLAHCLFLHPDLLITMHMLSGADVATAWRQTQKASLEESSLMMMLDIGSTAHCAMDSAKRVLNGLTAAFRSSALWSSQSESSESMITGSASAR